jgi:hypothetical protein
VTADHEPSVRSLADVADDLAADAAAAVRFAPPPAAEVGPRLSWRGTATAPRTAGGQRLLAGSPDLVRRRFATLARQEAAFTDADDYGLLIGPACQVLEAELDRLLVRPARAVAGELVAALEARPDDRDRAEVLRAWRDGSVKTTIGVMSLVLVALRRGCAAGRGPLCHFLDTHFRPGYVTLVTDVGPNRALDRIRTTYRNPACHGQRSFDAADYAAFARLAVACVRFDEWLTAGPSPEEPPAELGLLHHHLAFSRATPENAPAAPPRPGDRLLRLPTVAGPGWPLEVWVEHAERPTPRDLTAAAATAGFRRHDRVRLGLRSGRAGHAALIDVGTGGGVTLVWPSGWQPDRRLAAGGEVLVPPAGPDTFTLSLAGPPGTERLIGLAADRPLRLPTRPAGRGFTPLDAAATEMLAADLEGRPAGTWSAAVAAFEVA